MVANIGVTHPNYAMVTGDSNSLKHRARAGGESPDPGEDVPVVSSANEEVREGTEGEEDGLEGGEGVDGVHQHAQVGEKGKTASKGEGKGEEEGHRRNGEHLRTPEGTSLHQSAEELLQPAIQALAVLSNVSLCYIVHKRVSTILSIACGCVPQVLAHFIDCVFGSSEKDKISSLLKAVLFNVWPHLHNHRYG